jgi:hypothetical protein
MSVVPARMRCCGGPPLPLEGRAVACTERLRPWMSTVSVRLRTALPDDAGAADDARGEDLVAPAAAPGRPVRVPENSNEEEEEEEASRDRLSGAADCRWVIVVAAEPSRACCCC